jgi:cyanosortase A-associated protein
MLMVRWERIRFGLLIFIGCSLPIFLGKTIFFPETSQSDRTAKYTFPDRVPLAKWNQINSLPLSDRYPQPPTLLSSRVYQYQQSTLPLTIEMRYTVDKGGSLVEFIKQYTPTLTSSTTARKDSHRESTGFYTLFTSNKQAYLVSCINPRGSSTITAQQFNSNRYKYDLDLPRLFNWVIGKDNLRDLRCLWTKLSIPLNNLPPDKAYSTLESAWLDWYQWWYPRFPKL